MDTYTYTYAPPLGSLGHRHQSPPSSSRSKRFEETKSVLRDTIPAARRVLGENHSTTLKMRETCAAALYKDPAATCGDLREATTTLEDLERTTRRAPGGAHPLVLAIEQILRDAQDALYARGLP